MNRDHFGINWDAREFGTGDIGLEISVSGVQALIVQEKTINQFVINIRGFNNEPKAGEMAFSDHKTLATCIHGTLIFLKMFDALNHHLKSKLGRFMMLAELLDELNNVFAQITDVTSLKSMTTEILSALHKQHLAHSQEAILDDVLLYVATLDAAPDNVKDNLLKRGLDTIDRAEMLAILKLYNPEMAAQFKSQIDG